MKEFDIISIGGGSGGIATMNRAGEPERALLSLKKKQLGGTCVNRGCVPKKDYVVWCTNCRSNSRLWTRLWIYF